MSEDDIRSMLIEKISTLRKKLILNDCEEDGKLVNPFIDNVTEYAKGFPLYVSNQRMTSYRQPFSGTTSRMIIFTFI